MLKAGQIVKSVAGHDKDRFYVLLEVTEKYVAIADGKLRKIEKPKRKNHLHIAKTNSEIDLTGVVTNKKLREILTQYGRSSNKEGGDSLVQIRRY